MESSKTKVSYSVIRYSPDELKGEVINVGLLFYDYVNKKVKCFILDEKSPKLRAVIENSVENDIYKTNKEMLEYYLQKSKEDITGMVGDIYIASYFEDDFIEKYYTHYKDKQLTFSKPNVAFTKNQDKLFETILKKYVGESNVDLEKTTTMTAKKYMKSMFDSNKNLSARIQSDLIIKPIKELDDLEIKIDFTFKNGRWNYMQAIPKISRNNKNIDWFSKVELMLKSEDVKSSKIHLLYKKSDIIQDIGTYNLLKYLKQQYTNIDIHDVDRQQEVSELCNYIETEGQILNEVV